MENTTSEKPTTRAVGIRYGIILAAISIIYFLITAMMQINTNEGAARWISLVFAIVVFYLAHKYYKDNGDSFMSYGQGIGIAFWISLIASTASSIFTYIYIKFIDPEWVNIILDAQLEGMQEKGMSDEEIEMAMSMTEKFMTPEMILIFGIVIGISMGLIVALIVTIFTQKKNPEPGF